MNRKSLLLIVLFGSVVVASNRAQAKVKASDSGVQRFVLEVVGREQTLEVGKRSGKLIPVVLQVDGGCSRTVKGSAKEVVSGGDSEIETDPEGEGHPVDEFIFSPVKGCEISVRLSPERDYAWVRESGCTADCPLSDTPMTRK